MIEFKHVSFQYEGNEQEKMENINLTIEKGECILLCGRSGCGKTTFTRMINGLIPNFFPGKISGEVIVEGMNIAKTPMCEIAKKVGSVFQNPRTQFFNKDTDGEIAFGIENEGIPSEVIKNRVNETIKDLNIEKLSKRNIFKLSGGEKQKIAFASVYAMNPDVYLLDEPSSNLDMEAIDELKETLLNLKKQGKTILVAEHRIHYLMGVMDRAFYFNKGNLQKIYSPGELLKLSDRERDKLGLRACDLSSVKRLKIAQSTCNGTFEIKNLTIQYKRKKVLDNINLTAKKGEVIGIVGHNGAGKTTFSRAICGLHKDRNGEIYYNGKLQSGKSLMKNSYLVMQDVNYQLFAESVEKECIFGMKNPDIDLAGSVLEQLELAQYAKKHPNTLSGGQKQRLAVATSMICGKQILVFDEPTSGLDYDNMIRVSKLINQLSQQGKVIFIITHDYEFTCRTCSRVLRFDDGKKQEDYLITREHEMKLQKLFCISGNYLKSEGTNERRENHFEVSRERRIV